MKKQQYFWVCGICCKAVFVKCLTHVMWRGTSCLHLSKLLFPTLHSTSLPTSISGHKYSSFSRCPQCLLHEDFDRLGWLEGKRRVYRSAKKPLAVEKQRHALHVSRRSSNPRLPPLFIGSRQTLQIDIGRVGWRASRLDQHGHLSCQGAWIKETENVRNALIGPGISTVSDEISLRNVRVIVWGEGSEPVQQANGNFCGFPDQRIDEPIPDSQGTFWAFKYVHVQIRWEAGWRFSPWGHWC